MKIDVMRRGEIRRGSHDIARKLGFHIPASLPLLNEEIKPRGKDKAIDRALIVSAVVATSYGLNRDIAWSWLDQESLIEGLSDKERSFLDGSDEPRKQFQAQVETLCAFAWSLKLLPDMDFARGCPDNLVSIYPDLKILEPAGRFRKGAELREEKELVEACDLAYCLHWGLNQAMVDGIKPKRRLSQIVVAERRRALEWILGAEAWDDITLDT